MCTIYGLKYVINMRIISRHQKIGKAPFWAGFYKVGNCHQSRIYK